MFFSEYRKVADDRFTGWASKSLDDILWRQYRVAMTRAAKMMWKCFRGAMQLTEDQAPAFTLEKKGGIHQPGKVSSPRMGVLPILRQAAGVLRDRSSTDFST
ncbi:hypothetical protein PoB_001619000 [Plakobranchus ocellatus]|uniref:Uncharacterized protein n=1 Tax=Plakobranchus ocellatus TaxID=259542 RepID=A0AAV3Z3E5_9GAST|nr:hypothetical protein PoB_001619000 [Plakobranchus ocellatus]